MSPSSRGGGNPMTEKTFYRDPYRRELDAVVTAADGLWVVLDRTLFYPQGGGQPGDTGELVLGDGRRLAVTDARHGEGATVRLQVAGDAPVLAPGDAVRQLLHWERRHRHMRMHTCLHLLGSLIPRGVTGGAVGEGRSRLDFDAGDAVLDAEALTAGLNELVRADHPVTVEWVDEAVLEHQPELVRTMSVQPPRGVGALRMVRIPGVDYQPCGGTHVARTGEIGPVRVTRIESKGRRNRRVHVELADPEAGSP